MKSGKMRGAWCPSNPLGWRLGGTGCSWHVWGSPEQDVVLSYAKGFSIFSTFSSPKGSFSHIC